MEDGFFAYTNPARSRYSDKHERMRYGMENGRILNGKEDAININLGVRFLCRCYTVSKLRRASHANDLPINLNPGAQFGPLQANGPVRMLTSSPVPMRSCQAFPEE